MMASRFITRHSSITASAWTFWRSLASRCEDTRTGENTPLYFLLGTSGGHGDWVATARGIRWLLDHGSDPNISCGEDHETALHVAVREEHDTGILREILEAGADPNRADKNGVLPLTLAYRAGREDVVAVLKKWGAREVGLTVRERFFEAALSGDRERALTLVRENPELIATFEEEDLLSLNEAAKRGKVEAVRTLLDCGFDIAFKRQRQLGLDASSHRGMVRPGRDGQVPALQGIAHRHTSQFTGGKPSARLGGSWFAQLPQSKRRLFAGRPRTARSRREPFTR
jgi:hypothetical protein